MLDRFFWWLPYLFKRVWIDAHPLMNPVYRPTRMYMWRTFRRGSPRGFKVREVPIDA